MRLTFPADKLRELLTAAESRWPLGLRPRWGVVDPAGFWLVGDQGVYRPGVQSRHHALRSVVGRQTGLLRRG